MTGIPDGWHVDESVQEKTYTERPSSDWMDYVMEQKVPAKRTHAEYTSEDEPTIVSVGELYRPGKRDDTLPFVYLWEANASFIPASIWIHRAGDDVKTVKENARRLVVAREETSYSSTDFEFAHDLRERVPELSVHTEHTGERDPPEYGETLDVVPDLPEPTGHPLESFFQGYVAGMQFGKSRGPFICDHPDCHVLVEGWDESSWDTNSTLMIGRTAAEEFVTLSWRCSNHPTDSLEPLMTDIPDPEIVEEVEARSEEERSLINERVEKLEEAEAFADVEEQHDESTIGASLSQIKRKQARAELEAEGIINERTTEEKQIEAKVSALDFGPEIDCYYLVRCDIDCMCFSRYYWNVSYIRNPSVVDEYQYA